MIKSCPSSNLKKITQIYIPFKLSHSQNDIFRDPTPMWHCHFFPHPLSPRESFTKKLTNYAMKQKNIFCVYGFSNITGQKLQF